MVAYKIKVNVTESRKVEIILPDEFPLGEADVMVTQQAFIGEKLEFNPSTLGEILDDGLVGLGSDLEIEDSVRFVDEIRRKEQERRGVWTDS
jgi:hypothetical protein